MQAPLVLLREKGSYSLPVALLALLLALALLYIAFKHGGPVVGFGPPLPAGTAGLFLPFNSCRKLPSHLLPNRLGIVRSAIG